MEPDSRPESTNPVTQLSPQAEAVLAELVGAIDFGQGVPEMTLLVIRCNYQQYREALLTELVTRLESEDLQGAVHILRFDAPKQPMQVHVFRNAAAQPLQPLRAVDILHALQTTMEEGLPGAVMLVGLDSLTSMEQFWTDLNPRREECRHRFPFPLLLWLDDDSYGKFCQFANDFESIASGGSLIFEPTSEQLHQWLQGAIANLFAALFQLDLKLTFNRRLEGWNSEHLRQDELAIAFAELQSRHYPIDPELQASITFVQGLDQRTEEADQLFEQSATFWRDHPHVADAALKQGVASYYWGRALYFAADNVKYEDPEWEPAVAPLRQSLAIFEACDRPDLVSLSSIPLQRVLHRLEWWDELEQLTQSVYTLHQTYGDAKILAQDFGFWADIALHRQQFQQAVDLANRAIDTLEQGLGQSAMDEWWRILYLKTLARAETALGEIAAATRHLEIAQKMGVMGHPKIYSDVLYLLQQRLRDLGRYAEAFEVKQERLAIEQQYGLRAFIGAGRLRSHRTADRPTVRSHRQTLEDIAPEIAASGRSKDLAELLDRIGGKTHKLIALYGTSGVGKSSLVNGGLIPALQNRALNNRTNIPIVIRKYANWQQELADAMAIALGKNEERGTRNEEGSRESGVGSQAGEAKIQNPKSKIQNSPTPHPLTHILRQCDDLLLRPVLIFDQFEEFFFANPNTLARRQFFQFVVDCLELPGALKIVLSLRQDYLHYLLEARQAMKQSQLPPGSMARSLLDDILGKQILYEIGNFTPEETQEVIQQLTSGARMYLEPALVDALVTDLAEPLGEVRPIEMQVVGAQLQTQGITTLDRYQALGDDPKETLVQGYLEDVVQDCGDRPTQQLAELVLFLLTDERGTRPLKTRSQLEQELVEFGSSGVQEFGGSDQPSNASTPQPLNASTPKSKIQNPKFSFVLHVLCGSGLVMEIPDTPLRYQLVHDYLAEVIQARQKSWSDLLKEERQKRLQAEDLQQKTAAELAAAQRKNQQARRRVAISSGLLVVSLLAVVVITPQMFKALGRADEATKREQEANQGLERAQTELGTNQEALVAVQDDLAEKEAAVADAERLLEAEQAKLKAEQAKLKAVEGESVAAVQAATQRVAAAQAQFDRAQAALAMAEATLTETQALQRQAETQRQQAEAQRRIAEDEAQIARTGTQLERQGVAALRKFEIQQTEALLTALQSGHGLNDILQRKNIQKLENYPAASPLYALQSTLDQQQETRFEGHSGRVWQVAFSPDGQRLATSGDDGTARLWDLRGNQIAQYEGRLGDFNHDWSRVYIIQPGNNLISDPIGEVVTAWRVDDLETLIARACERLGPYLRQSSRVTAEDRAMCGL